MILDQIVEKKSDRLKNTSFMERSDYLSEIKKMKNPPSFYEAMGKEGLSIIGEVKKASPSKGIIKADFNPKEIACEYGDAVDAISVLTEQDFFKGSPKYLEEVRKVSDLPILRKDFIIDENQIYEARIIGASAVLLITAILEEEKLREFIEIAESIDLDALVEVHTREEVETAIRAGAKIIGINNRNLKDFSVDLKTTLDLSKVIPEEILVISESGIATEADIVVLKEAEIDGILVGESFMRCEDIPKKAKEFKMAYED